MENHPPSAHSSMYSPHANPRSPVPLRTSNNILSTLYAHPATKEKRQELGLPGEMDPSKSLISPPPEDILRSAERPRQGTHSRSNSTSFQVPRHLQMQPQGLQSQFSSPTRRTTSQHESLSLSKRKRPGASGSSTRSPHVSIRAYDDVPAPMPASVENTPNPKPRKISKHIRTNSNLSVLSGGDGEGDVSMHSPTRPSRRQGSLDLTALSTALHSSKPPSRSQSPTPVRAGSQLKSVSNSPSKRHILLASPHTHNPNADYLPPIAFPTTNASTSTSTAPNLLTAPLSHRRRSRSATPIPPYEPPPREQYTPPREIILSTPTISKSAKRKSVVPKSIAKLKADAEARASLSLSTKSRSASAAASTKGKLGAKGRGKLHIKTEPPEIDLGAPLPPPSPTDDPLLLLGRPRHPVPRKSSGPVLEGQPRHVSPSLASTSPVSLSGRDGDVEADRHGWGDDSFGLRNDRGSFVGGDDIGQEDAGVNDASMAMDVDPTSLFDTAGSWSDSDEDGPHFLPAPADDMENGSGEYEYRVSTKGSPFSGFSAAGAGPSVEHAPAGDGGAVVDEDEADSAFTGGHTLSQLEMRNASSRRRSSIANPSLVQPPTRHIDDADDADLQEHKEQAHGHRQRSLSPPGEYGGGLTLSQIEQQRERRPSGSVAPAPQEEDEEMADLEPDVPSYHYEEGEGDDDDGRQLGYLDDDMQPDMEIPVVDHSQEIVDEDDSHDADEEEEEARIDRALSQEPSSDVELDVDEEAQEEELAVDVAFDASAMSDEDTERDTEHLVTLERDAQAASARFASIRARFFNAGSGSGPGTEERKIEHGMSSATPLPARSRFASPGPSGMRSIADDDVPSNFMSSRLSSEPRSLLASRRSIFSPTSVAKASHSSVANTLTPTISNTAPSSAFSAFTPSTVYASPSTFGQRYAQQKKSDVTPLSTRILGLGPPRRVLKAAAASRESLLAPAPASGSLPIPSFVINTDEHNEKSRAGISNIPEDFEEETALDADKGTEDAAPMTIEGDYQGRDEVDAQAQEQLGGGIIEDVADVHDNAEDDADDADDSVDSIDPSVVSITSSDPKAAARAAAILKLYDYDMLPHIRMQRLRTSGSRRKTVISGGVTKALIPAREREERARRRATLGGVIGDEVVVIPGAPVTTLPQLLHDAEVELERDASVAGSMMGSVAGSPVKSRSRGSTPIPFPGVDTSANANFEGGRDNYRTPPPASPRRRTRTTSGPIDFELLRSSEWTKSHWKLLDSCLTDLRILQAEDTGLPEGTLVDADDVDSDGVIDRFLEILGEVVDLGELGEEWTSDMILRRLIALQKKQAAGMVAPPTPSSRVPLSRSRASSPAFSVPDFTPTGVKSVVATRASTRTNLPPPATDQSTPFASLGVKPRMPAPLFAPRYSHLLDEAVSISRASRSSPAEPTSMEDRSELDEDYPVSEASQDQESASMEDGEYNGEEPAARRTSVAHRVKGFFTSYLPLIKSTPAVKKPFRPQRPGLPLPPPEVLGRERGPITTPAPKEHEKAIPHKELVDLNHVPLPPPSLIPRAAKPQRLVELNHIEPPQPKPKPNVIPGRRRSSSSSSSVKDLVRNFEQLDESEVKDGRLSRMPHRPRSVMEWRKGMPGAERLNKPVWKP